MKFSRIMCLILSAICVFALTSCGADPAASDTTAPSPSTEADVTTMPARVWPTLTQLSDISNDTLYQRASDAATAGSYQYAYALYSYLALEQYSDSISQATALRSFANRTPIQTAPLSDFTDIEVGSDMDSLGFLYADANGVPQYIYQDITQRMHTITLDESMTGVVSICQAQHLYPDDSETKFVSVYTCVMSDLTVRAIYTLPDDIEPLMAQRIADYAAHLTTEQDVVLVARCSETLDTVFLHSDGTVTYYCDASYDSVMRSNWACLDSWQNITDLHYGNGYIEGLHSNGSIECIDFVNGPHSYDARSTCFAFVHTDYPFDVMLDTDDGYLWISTLYSIDADGNIRAVALSDDHVYHPDKIEIAASAVSYILNFPNGYGDIILNHAGQMANSFHPYYTNIIPQLVSAISKTTFKIG